MIAHVGFRAGVEAGSFGWLIRSRRQFTQSYLLVRHVKIHQKAGENVCADEAISPDNRVLVVNANVTVLKFQFANLDRIRMSDIAGGGASIAIALDGGLNDLLDARLLCNLAIHENPGCACIEKEARGGPVQFDIHRITLEALWAVVEFFQLGLG